MSHVGRSGLEKPDPGAIQNPISQTPTLYALFILTIEEKIHLQTSVGTNVLYCM